MSTVNAFQTAIKEFISSNVLKPLAKVSVDNRDASVDELVQRFIVELDLPMTVPTAPVDKPKKRKSPSPKADQKWITYDQYNDFFEREYICGYVQTRGKSKDHYCGIVLDNTNVVTWSKEGGFADSTPEKELEAVDGKRCDMRCKLCWSRDPKTGEYKRKKGRGEKLNSEHKGDIVAPTVIPGVSVPDNAGLMGFLSGNNKSIQSPTRAMDTVKKVIRAKRFTGLERNEDYSHVIPNPEHHENMPWLIRHDENGQVVIGKFESSVTPTRTFEDSYIDDIVPLNEDDLEVCSEYNIKYVPYEKPDDDVDIPVVHDREDDTSTIQDDIDVPTLDIDDLLNN